MVSFPPHCSYKLQILDRTVFVPLKRFYNSACDNWMVTNPRPMTIYNIVLIVRGPYTKAFLPSNIESKSPPALNNLSLSNDDGDAVRYFNATFFSFSNCIPHLLHHKNGQPVFYKRDRDK